ncbi:MAG: glycoside hydrolase family 25 protein [Lachnospiraceae bacterium]|nr:glycoside hydrolase family 25 protein [Lachnospiraceae bacterium]
MQRQLRKRIRQSRKSIIILSAALVLITLTVLLLLLVFTTLRGNNSEKTQSVEFEYKEAADTDMPPAPEPAGSYEDEATAKEWAGSEDSIADQEEPEGPEILEFVDAFGEKYETGIRDGVPRAPYSREAYSAGDDMKYSYEDDSYTSRLGIDVSHHQGRIDWQAVKADGFDFAFIRLGYRGYGETGSVNLDKLFDENADNARAAGLDVGVYFFAQAINEEEAKEEAEFVLKHLEGHDINLEVVYDPESILDAKARTDDVSGEQFTKNTQVFCSIISEAGYKPMVYSNMKWEAFQFDMTKLTDLPFWYADYEPIPQTPYDFRYWQYTNEGRAKGVSGAVDLNMEFIKK